MRNLRVNKLLFMITGLCALVASAAGVYAPGMYDSVVAHRIMPGAYAQDIFALASALILIVNALWMKSDDYRKVVVSCGVLGFFFYAFGIYAIEQVYTPLYPLYLTILALSFYSLIYALASLKRDAIEQIKLPRSLLIGAAGYGFFIAVLFNVIWFGQLVPLPGGKRPDRIHIIPFFPKKNPPTTHPPPTEWLR